MKRGAAACAIAIAVVAQAGCKKKKSTEEAPAAAAPGSAAARAPAVIAGYVVPDDGAIDVDRLVASFRNDRTHVLTEQNFHYVHANGKLDRKFGEVHLKTGALPDDDPRSANDPDRPLGAPVVDAPVHAFAETCAEYRVEAGGVVSSQPGLMCLPMLPNEARDACTIATLWQLAIADGAPANALASFDLQPGGWWVSIDDEPRNYHFNKRYEGVACRAVPEGAQLPAEAMPIDAAAATASPPPLPPGESAPPAPALLDAVEDRVRPAMVKCAERIATLTESPVGLGLRVDDTGKATVYDVVGAYNPGRQCLVDVVEAATWPKTGARYSFSFPIVFSSPSP